MKSGPTEFSQKEAQQHYKYVYVCMITDEYEKAAIKQGAKKMNRAASMVQGLPMMRALDISIDSIETILIDRIKNAVFKAMVPMDPKQKSASVPSPEEQGAPEPNDEPTAVAANEASVTSPESPCDVGGIEAEQCDPTEKEQAANPEAGIEGTNFSLPDFGNANDPTSVFWRCGKWADEDWGGFPEDHWSKVDIDGKDGVDLSGVFDGWMDQEWMDQELIDNMTNAEFLENCFNCTWDINYGFNLPPIEILGALEKFLKEIEDILDWIIDKINPTNMAQKLCQLFDLFKWYCPPTWILLLGMLKALLSKYMMQSLRLKLDWTAIIGLIIKTLIEWLAALLEQLKRLITMPMDCIRNIIAMFSSLYKAFGQAGDAIHTFGNYYFTSNPDSLWDKDSATSILSGEAWKNSGYEEFIDVDSPASGEWAGLWPNTEVRNTFSNDEKSWADTSNASDPNTARIAEEDPDWPGPPKVNKGGKKSFGSHPGNTPAGWLNNKGIDVAGQTMAPRAKQEMSKFTQKYNPMENLMVMINDFKKWIEDLFNRVIQTLKSLQALFNGNLTLNIQNMGFIVMLLDMISLIMGLASFGISWDCEDGQLEPDQDLIEKLCQEAGVDLSDESQAELASWAAPLTSAGADGKVGIKSKSGLFEGEIDLYECRAWMGAMDSDSEERWKAMQESFDFNQYGYQGPMPNDGDV